MAVASFSAITRFLSMQRICKTGVPVAWVVGSLVGFTGCDRNDDGTGIAVTSPRDVASEEPELEAPTSELTDEPACEVAYRHTVRVMQAALAQPDAPFGTIDGQGRRLPPLKVPTRAAFLKKCEAMPEDVQRCRAQRFTTNTRRQCQEIILTYLRAQGRTRPPKDP